MSERKSSYGEVNYSEEKAAKLKAIEANMLPMQELPLSDSDIQLILDCLHHAQRSIEKAIGQSREMLNKEIISAMIDRTSSIQDIINKLNEK